MIAGEFWMLLSGLGLFLYGMFHLEDSMKQFDGRSFKLFLQKHTQHKLPAILSGLTITALLQSSSIVNLMVLSFVGAGMLSMRNAIAVVLGNNIGGTFNSWLVAMLGFEVELNLVTLPIIGVAGVTMIAFKNKRIIARIARFGMGFGLLLLGLQFMKESMDSMIKHFDFTPYLNYHLIVFVLIGFVITSLIQTSAATIVLVLSALYAKIIPIETAVAVVLGAELGTTIKVVLGSIGGIASKKRVALGNFIFNVITSMFGFILLIPILNIIHHSWGIKDPIIVLVAFQTFINIAGVILFYFFLNHFGDFLEKRFEDKNSTVTKFLPLTSHELSDTAVDMMEKEVELFIDRVIRLNMDAFHIEKEAVNTGKVNHLAQGKQVIPDKITHHEKYHLIKKAEGEILSFYARMLEHPNKKEQLVKMGRLMEALRNAMYSAKGMKDIYPDKQEFSNSINELKYNLYQELRKELTDFYSGLYNALSTDDQQNCSNQLIALFKKIRQEFDHRIGDFYTHAGKNSLPEKDIATMFNLNREIYSSCKALLRAARDYKLNAAYAEKTDTALVSA